MLGGQYIVTMNSDIFDKLPLSPDVDRSSIVLPTRLSDQGDNGGLFGRTTIRLHGVIPRMSLSESSPRSTVVWKLKSRMTDILKGMP